MLLLGIDFIFYFILRDFVLIPSEQNVDFVLIPSEQNVFVALQLGLSLAKFISGSLAVPEVDPVVL